MTDAFATLNLPSRPWLEGDLVRAAFQRAAAEAHPDRGGTEGRFAEISRAYETLRDPAARLRHWLSLRSPESLIPNSTPPELMDWFQPVAAQLRRLKEATQQKAVATSAVARASVIVEGRLAERLVEELERRREALLAPLREIGEDATLEVVRELAVSASTLAFLDKWIGQLREGLLLLRM